MTVFQKLVIVPSKKELGLEFKGNQKMVVEALEVSVKFVNCPLSTNYYGVELFYLFLSKSPHAQAMNEKEAMDMKTTLESKGEVDFHVCTLGKTVSIKKNMVSISLEKKKEHQRVFTPSVIEPSFGIGRIIYCLFEHSFYTRPSKAENGQLNVFSFPPLVAPIKCTVLPLVKTQKFDDVAKVIAKSLTAAGISHIMDTTGKLDVLF